MECRYYNDSVRCYSDGRIERKNKKSNQYGIAGEWREVKGTIDKGGYLTIGIDGVNEMFHRVIWESFNGKIPDGLTINHKDEIKTNNGLSNLELMTRGDNNRYGTRTQRTCKPVIGTSISTGEEIYFSSTVEAGKHGFDRRHISKCCNGVHKYKSHKGYTWKYV